MVMKIVLVAAVVMVLGHVTGQRCMTRKQMVDYGKLQETIKCRDPKPIPVQLPVPEGFDHVKPSVVMLRQCTGLYCSDFSERCLPEPGQTLNHTYKVYASRNEEQPVCAKATVQEHLACGCRCDKRACPSNRVFKTETCDCECNPHMKTSCDARRNVYGEEVMWSSKLCSCECDKVEQCNFRSFWDPNRCQCAAMF